MNSNCKANQDANALDRQSASDLRNAILWSEAGGFYDGVHPAKLNIEEGENGYTPTPGLKEQEWKACAQKYESPAVSHSIEIAALRCEIALHYRTAVAQSAVSLAGSSQEYYGYYHSSEALECATSAGYLIHALDYTEKALQCAGRGENELQALWSLCATYTKSAAKETSSPQSLATRATSFFSMAEKIAAVLRSWGSRPAAASTAEMNQVKKQLTQELERINESARSGGAKSLEYSYYFFTGRIESLICGINKTIQSMTAAGSTEQRAMQRFRAAADKVNVDQSPAHPHIKQCWLNAAELMRLAIAAGDGRTRAQYRQRAFQQERLARGPLTAAAHYFAKAASRGTTPQLQSLWKEAARLQLQVTVALLERYHRPNVDRMEFNKQEWAQVQRARARAEAATCVVHASTGAATVLQQAELQLRLAVVAWDAVPGRQQGIELRGDCSVVLKWCHDWSAGALVPTPAPDEPAPACDGDTPGKERRVGRAVWLCRVLTDLARLYATAGDVIMIPVDRLCALLSLYTERVFDSMETYVSPKCSAQIDVAVEALVESQRQVIVSNRAGAGPEEQQATQDSALQFVHSAKYVERGALCTEEYSHQNAATSFEKGERARQAGLWFAVAAQAAAAAQWEVHAAFTKAAECVGEPAVDERGRVTKRDRRFVYSDQERPVATKAGKRFARAAEALQAGDRELYEMWLKAAEATVRTVQGTGAGTLDVGDLLGDAEALALAAQQRQDAVTALSTFAVHVAGDDPAQDTAPVSSGVWDTQLTGEKRTREGVEEGF
jgi:hypothetical protein